MAYFNFHVKKISTGKELSLFYTSKATLFFQTSIEFFLQASTLFFKIQFINQCQCQSMSNDYGNPHIPNQFSSRTGQGIKCAEVKMAAQQQSNLVGRLTELVEVLISRFTVDTKFPQLGIELQ